MSITLIQRAFTEEMQATAKVLATHFSPPFSKILAQRGITNIDVAKYQYKLIPPNRLKGIDDFIHAIAEAKTKQLSISIVADYDCDGATSCAIAYKGLKMLGINKINFIVPNRFKHGYGISPSVVDDLIALKGKPDIILTVDNGIAAHAGIEYARNLGIKVIVTDHHLPIKDMPNPICEALVNPNQIGDTSGLQNMAGCGVIFYCLYATHQYLMENGHFPENAPNMLNLLDYVSLGTIADVVKLDQNNRLLVKVGLQRLRKKKTSLGMQALFSVAGKDIYSATSQDYGFSIAPRINAAGRLEDMTIGIQCLLSENFVESKQQAEALNEWNVKRKNIENEMKEIAQEIILDEQQEEKLTRVIFNPDFHEGVVGIVAGRLKEQYNVPSIVFSHAKEEGYIKGSGRSIPNIHLRDALDLVYKSDPTIFKGFGGHAMAAGLEIKADKLDKFKELFEESVKTLLGQDHPLNKEIIYDMELGISDLSIQLVQEIKNEIWGQGFPAPTFRGKFTLVEQSFLNSKGTDTPAHSKYILTDESGQKITALSFFDIEQLEVGKKYDMIFQPQLNEFRGEINIQLIISYKSNEL